MTRSRSSLAALSGSLTRFNFKETSECCRQVGINVRKRTPFRVTSRLSGKRNFRRLDLQRVVERALLDRGWYLAKGAAALDVWAEVHGDDGYISVKLSPNDMAQRPYKQAHIPASLKPTVAYSMVRLSRPHPDDVFLDRYVWCWHDSIGACVRWSLPVPHRRRYFYRGVRIAL